ncbi:MAG: hypothetical protein LBS05_05905 [Tannerellaceae bacterium]|nr:hypothetical protein [Tannerellaceae bacterium]
MWQEVAVILIGLATAGYVVRRIVRLIRARKRPQSPCDGCGKCPAAKRK